MWGILPESVDYCPTTFRVFSSLWLVTANRLPHYYVWGVRFGYLNSGSQAVVAYVIEENDGQFLTSDYHLTTAANALSLA